MSRPLQDFAVVKPGNFTRDEDFEIVSNELYALNKLTEQKEKGHKQAVETKKGISEIFGGQPPKNPRGSKVTSLPFPPMEYYKPHRRFPEGLIYINNAGIVMTIQNGEHVRLTKYNAPEIIREFMEDTPEMLEHNEAYERAMKVVI